VIRANVRRSERERSRPLVTQLSYESPNGLEVLEDAGNVFEEHDAGTDFVDEPDEVTQRPVAVAPSPVVAEPELSPGRRERLAREPTAQQVDLAAEFAAVQVA